MHNSEKEINISNMNFINSEFESKNKIRKIKTIDVHNSKKGILKGAVQRKLRWVKSGINR